MKYILLLRGVNVGGNSRVVMAELRQALSELGLTDVVSYINSGNVIFTSVAEPAAVTATIAAYFATAYTFDLRFVLLTTDEWALAVTDIPEWWGQNDTWRHNALFKLPGYDPEWDDIVRRQMTAENDRTQIGSRVIFWSAPAKVNYSRSFYSKLLKTPLYPLVSIRNRNTTLKLTELLRKSGN